MTLAEKSYALRRRSGLSQEQLAERLGVSRQAISKWESGASVPESGKLVAISEHFGVSLDYLMKDDAPQMDIGHIEPQTNEQPTASAPAQSKPTSSPDRTRWLLGAVACIVGGIGLIVWGLLLICSPAASERMSASSVITVDGRGIFLILCVAAIAAGAVLLLKSINKRKR